MTHLKANVILILRRIMFCNQTCKDCVML